MLNMCLEYWHTLVYFKVYIICKFVYIYIYVFICIVHYVSLFMNNLNK